MGKNNKLENSFENSGFTVDSVENLKGLSLEQLKKLKIDNLFKILSISTENISNSLRKVYQSLKKVYVIDFFNSENYTGYDAKRVLELGPSLAKEYTKLWKQIKEELNCIFTEEQVLELKEIAKTS